MGTILLIALMVVVLLEITIRLATFHPPQLQHERVVNTQTTPILKLGQKIRILSWNVQFMAGKNYVFWFDMLNLNGPDERSSKDDITKTFEAVARVIRDENPDIVLLQEIAHGHAATDHEDQLTRLRSLLQDIYSCYTSSFYVKAAYMPHPRVRGSTGIKLAILSKYEISTALRHQLPLTPYDPITQLFSPKRALLEARLPIEDGGELVILTTHLDALAQGTNTLARQVGQVNNILNGLPRSHLPWIIGGDFNLLPPDDESYQRLSESQKAYYSPQSDIAPLYKNHQAIPSSAEVTDSDYEKWFTHFPNDLAPAKLDKTLDYFFFTDRFQIHDHYVRQSDTQTLSDHLPLVAEFQLL
ncbi:MAG: endonuclease/exonuclease/phosphatase family protein [Anaerolineae bacterium]|nr:endonuclease/exonuclease/phosphatase family protein [Anaerolineae bacterium]